MASNLSLFSDEALTEELVKRGLFEGPGFIKEKIYQLGAMTLPIICVDLIPVKKEEKEFMIGVIRRATGPEAGQLAVTGGRIKKDQTVLAAIEGHLIKDLSIERWHFWPGNTEERPFYVQQYLHQNHGRASYGFDPTKHAVALTYLIEIEGAPRPKNEANRFLWITQKEIPPKTAYDHGKVMKQAFSLLGLVSK